MAEHVDLAAGGKTDDADAGGLAGEATATRGAIGPLGPGRGLRDACLIELPACVPAVWVGDRVRHRVQVPHRRLDHRRVPVQPGAIGRAGLAESTVATQTVALLQRRHRGRRIAGGRGARVLSGLLPGAGLGIRGDRDPQRKGVSGDSHGRSGGARRT